MIHPGTLNEANFSNYLRPQVQGRAGVTPGLRRKTRPGLFAGLIWLRHLRFCPIAFCAADQELNAAIDVRMGIDGEVQIGDPPEVQARR